MPIVLHIYAHVSVHLNSARNSAKANLNFGVDIISVRTLYYTINNNFIV